MATLPPLPAATKKVFVAYLDTHLGAQLVQRFLAMEFEVQGLLLDPANASSIPSKVRRVLKRTDIEAVRKAVLESDLIIYQLVSNVEDAIAGIRLLTLNHYESEKRFVLVSSTLTWFETPPLQEPAPAGEGEDVEIEAVTEDQYNRRVPHVKYLAWRDVEKMAISANGDRLKTMVLFAGLVYGLGEDVLHPLFKQAWSLAAEGLPIFGAGRQLIPMIHVADLTTAVVKALQVQEIPEMRYIFAVDEGNCTWSAIVTALNTALGNGRTFRVPSHEFGLHENVELFTQNLRVESGQLRNLLADESDWVCKSGIVENMELVVSQYRQERRVQPLRIVVLGPPAVGKSYISREIASAMSIPHFTLGDVVQEYRYQEVELKDEISRIKEAKVNARIQQLVDDKREQILAERKSAAEAEIANKVGGEALPDDDNDDVEEEEEVEVHLSAEEKKEIQDEINADDSDETIAAINEKLDEVKRVLAMRLKPLAGESQEPPNPKDKKKAPAAKKSKEPVEPPKEEHPKDVRYSDRAIAFMVKWKLTRTQCRNQGYVLDGYPKTIRQARLVFEDVPIEIPEDPEEPEPPLEKEEKPCSDTIFPELVLHLKAGDTFLLERLQKIQHEHPHNAPEDFQRRLELYKTNFDAPAGVIQYLESARTTNGKMATVKTFDMEACPLVPPPAPKSRFAPKVADPIAQRVIEAIGKPRNFGPTPQDAQREIERVFNLEAEQRAEREGAEAEKRQKEAVDVANAKLSKSEESVKLSAMKETERQMLEQRKGPLKAYLMANVVPVLTKGLIEVCNQRPDDPVDFLAEWLFKHNPEEHPDFYS